MDKDVLLRFPDERRSIQFSMSESEEMKPTKTVPWTLYDVVHVDRIGLKERKVELSGTRDWVKFKDGKMVILRTGLPFSIELDRDPGISDAQVDAALRKVFLNRSEKLSSLLPSYWNRVADTAIGTTAADPQTGEAGEGRPSDVLRVGHGVEAPRLIKQRDPGYTPQAKQVKLQGVCTLSLILDEHGDVIDIKIVKPLGIGLDEEAVDAVKRWKFQPAMLKGHPVKVAANVEVNFHLY